MFKKIKHKFERKKSSVKTDDGENEAGESQPNSTNTSNHSIKSEHSQQSASVLGSVESTSRIVQDNNNNSKGIVHGVPIPSLPAHPKPAKDIETEQHHSSQSFDSFESMPSRPKGFSGLEIDPKDIVILERIGADRGVQGRVYKAVVYGQEVCVKELKLPKNKDGRKEIANFKNEVRLLSEITHKNVCMFLGACLEEGKWRLVTELLKGDLSDIVFNNKVHLSLYDKLKMARDIAKGMAWLHQCGVLHLDMKIENFLVDEYGTIKVSDFGFSKIYEVVLGIKNVKGTSEGGAPLYKSPERFLGKEYGPPADVYSFGIVFWQLITREEPFKKYQDIGDIELFKNVVCFKGERPSLAKVQKLHLPQAEELLTACWADEPSKRPTFRQIIKTLDPIMVDSAVEDPMGRQFWKDYFIEKQQSKTEQADFVTLRTEVPWEKFIQRFAKFLDLDQDILYEQLPTYLSDTPLPSDAKLYLLQQATEDVLQTWGSNSEKHKKLVQEEFERRAKLLKLNCLKFFLVELENAVEVVSLLRFGKIIDIFGPIDSKENKMLDKMFNIMNQPWFHGDIDQKEAFTLLGNQKPGSYLVRFSGTRNSFVISCVVASNRQAVRHLRVIHTKKEGKSKVSIETLDDTYDSIEELLQQNGGKDGIFLYPVTSAPTKYRFLTTVPTSVDIGYLEDRAASVNW